jgi:predicted nucleotidyltransferase
MLPQHKALLDSFLNKVSSLSSSIVLTGSQVNGIAEDESDIDLIIVTETTDKANLIQRIAEDYRGASIRPLLDCKVYSQDEFYGAKSGLEGRFIWTCLITGKI